MTTRTISDIACDVATQDNAITENPIFVVQRQRRTFGMTDDYTDDFVWMSMDSERTIADDETATKLDAMREDYFSTEITLTDADGTRQWTRVGYRDTWEFVTACFTRAGCEAYLRINGHNIQPHRIYVEGGYRNHEWETMRAYLLALPKLHAAMRAVGDAYAKDMGEALGDAIDEMLALIPPDAGAP